MTEQAKTGHQRRSSLAADGSRLKIRVGEIHGRFTHWRRITFFCFIAIYAVLPMLNMHGHPVIFINITERHFYLFGQTFNAQDTYLLFFLLAGGLLSLFVLTASLGRLWCGWGCPQTVFLEFVFRPIERWVEGPKPKQIALETGPWNAKKFMLLGRGDQGYCCTHRWRGRCRNDCGCGSRCFKCWPDPRNGHANRRGSRRCGLWCRYI